MVYLSRSSWRATFFFKCSRYKKEGTWVMNSSPHRIYHVLSKPPSFLGLTFDELVLLIGGGAFSFHLISIQHALLGVVCLISTIVSIGFIKKFKKLSEGFSIKSYLYMHGIWPKPSNTYPSWKVREYAP